MTKGKKLNCADCGFSWESSVTAVNSSSSKSTQCPECSSSNVSSS